MIIQRKPIEAHHDKCGLPTLMIRIQRQGHPPLFAPELKTPVAKDRSLQGNHSTTVFIAGGNLRLHL